MNKLARLACKQFSQALEIQITALGNGLINDTFLVKTDKQQFVLQRINPQVFSKPDWIMQNLIHLNQHISQKNSVEVKLKVPTVLTTIDQKTYYIDEQNAYWRALEFIKDTVSKESIDTQDEAAQVGFALAHFHRLLSDASLDLFQDTLPGFHITPIYFQHYQGVEKQNKVRGDSQKIQFCREFIAGFRAKINCLEDARQQGLLTDRIIHGDPKLNNFLFDNQSHEIISLIDLDTVKPGLVHYDIADCLRSCCHNTQSNTFDLKLCTVILISYLKQASAFFTEQDYEFLYPAIQLIPFELGLRFFTDFLEGNQYFKVDFPEQNLNRALALFYLCQSIEQQEIEIRQLITRCRSAALGAN
ncbi:MAG: phosphotransferase enzyme family protein [Methylococcaceae bacterium]